MDAPPPPPWPSLSPKKRKFERVQGQESPPGSGSASAGLDLINALPDAVLCTIVSLLPTKDGARTQAVARRWRPLWRSAPLNLVADSTLSRQVRKRVVYVSQILAEHPGPALRFKFTYIRRCDYPKIDGWLRSQALTDLQELHLGYDDEDSPLSLSALRFAPTLRGAIFTCCHFPDLSAQSLNFPHLKQLMLDAVTVPALSAHSLNFPHLKQLTMCEVAILGDALHNMLSSCLSLESLLLQDIVGFARLSISSPTLRSIGFSAPYSKGAALFQELVIDYAPCLERLLPLDPDYGPATVRIIRAPKLQVLGLLSNGISTLHVGTTVFQEMTAISVTTAMRTVKVLAIESVGPNLDAVIGFLKCFPCLERLYVILQLQMEMKNVQKYDPLDPIECLESYLKRVVLENYSGDMRHMPDVEFAKFFVLNAKVLEEMKFVSSDSSDCDWKSNQHMWLQVDSRASPDARLEFVSSCEDALTDYKRTHDLSMADPLERTFNLD